MNGFKLRLSHSNLFKTTNEDVLKICVCVKLNNKRI